MWMTHGDEPLTPDDLADESWEAERHSLYPCPATEPSLAGTVPATLPTGTLGRGLPVQLPNGTRPRAGQATPSPRERVSVPSHTRAGHQPSDTLEPPYGGSGSNLDTRLLDGRVPNGSPPRRCERPEGMTTT
jgi:hypothetical protein